MFGRYEDDTSVNFGKISIPHPFGIHVNWYIFKKCSGRPSKHLHVQSQQQKHQKKVSKLIIKKPEQVIDIVLELTRIPLLNLLIPWSLHCVKSVQIRSYFWSLFSCIWTEYGYLLRKSAIKSEYRKIRIRNNSLFGQFSCSSWVLVGYRMDNRFHFKMSLIDTFVKSKFKIILLLLPFSYKVKMIEKIN